METDISKALMGWFKPGDPNRPFPKLYRLILAQLFGPPFSIIHTPAMKVDAGDDFALRRQFESVVMFQRHVILDQENATAVALSRAICR